jgi:putative transposase
VHIAGIVNEPGERWMLQIARNLLDAVDGFLLGRTHLILDRDPLYTKRFRLMLKRAAVTPVRLPANSPNLNGYAERFVGSIRRECLNLIVPLGEQHLRHVIRQ